MNNFLESVSSTDKLNINFLVEAKMYYPLRMLISEKGYDDVDQIIYMLNHNKMIAGGFVSTTKNILIKGLSISIGSFLERKVDTKKIDHNIRKGANERKAYDKKLRAHHKKHNKHKKHHSSSKKKKHISNETPIILEPTKKNTTQIGPKGKHTSLEHPNTIKLSADTTTENYKQGIDIIKTMNITNPIDLPITPPLDEPPVGLSGATILSTTTDKILIQNKSTGAVTEQLN